MSCKRNIALLFISLLACTGLITVVSAQVIDPCWYGCPKSGCPQCPEGGPIKKTQEGAMDDSRESCVKDCQKSNRDRVKDCNIYFPSSSQPAKHGECLDKAKTIFDACMATC